MSLAPLVPPLVSFLAKHPLIDKFDLSSLKAISSGAAPLSRDLEVKVAERIPNLERVAQGKKLSYQKFCLLPVLYVKYQT